MKTTNLPPYKRFLEQLAKARADSKLTQAELGRRLGMRQSYVSKVESGERRLDLVEYIFWCKVLDIEPAVLLEQLAGRIGRVMPDGSYRATFSRR